MTELERRANEMRADIVRMIAGGGKRASRAGRCRAPTSCAALYFGGVLEHDPANPQWEGRDRFILAKGHAAPALYAVLAHAGYFPREELMTLRKLGSRLQGHPDSNQVPGVEVSTGSLGQGLSIAAGCAAGLALDGRPQTVFALLGDGECQEGQVWEAAMFAAHRGLDNLVAIVDRNSLQIDGARPTCATRATCARSSPRSAGTCARRTATTFRRSWRRFRRRRPTARAGRTR